MDLINGEQLRQANPRYSGCLIERGHAVSTQNDQTGILQEVHFELNRGVNLEVGLTGEDVTANVVFCEVNGGQEVLLPKLRNYLALLVSTFELIKWTEGELL